MVSNRRNRDDKNPTPETGWERYAVFVEHTVAVAHGRAATPELMRIPVTTRCVACLSMLAEKRFFGKFREDASDAVFQHSPCTG